MNISVYITSYNQKGFLKEAVESVLKQSLTPYEVIIVDDASTDGSQELILGYAKKHKIIKYCFHKKNKGVANVRVTALNMVKGDFVTYLDGDDLYLPNKLEIESEIIKKEGCDLAFTNNMYVNPNNPLDIKWIWACDNINIKDETNLFVKTLSRDFPRQSLFRMELINYDFIKNIGFHDSNLKLYEDYELRIRIAKTAKMGYSLEPTAKIRISKNGLSKLSKPFHLEALEYIFNKYDDDINNLDKTDRSKVLLKKRELLGTSLKKRKKTLKEIIKILINKI